MATWTGVHQSLLECQHDHFGAFKPDILAFVEVWLQHQGKVHLYYRAAHSAIYLIIIFFFFAFFSTSMELELQQPFETPVIFSS